MLIADQGQHDLILGRERLAEQRVLLNCSSGWLDLGMSPRDAETGSRGPVQTSCSFVIVSWRHAKNFSKIWLGCCLRSCKSSREIFVRLFFNYLNAKICWPVWLPCIPFFWSFLLGEWSYVWIYNVLWTCLGFQSWDLHVVPRDCTKSLKMDGRPFRPWVKTEVH